MSAAEDLDDADVLEGKVCYTRASPIEFYKSARSHAWVVSGAGVLEADWGEFGNTILYFARAGVSLSCSIDLRKPIGAVERAILAQFGLGRPFGVVTPQNPYGQLCPAETNATLAVALQQDLAANDVQYVPLDACSPDHAHCEQSVALLLPREDVVALARRYGQLAVFWFDGDRFWILPALSATPMTALPFVPPANRSNEQG